MDDVWVMALSLAIGSLVLVWLLLYVRFGKSIVDNGGKKGVVKDRRFSPPQARNGTRTSPSTNGSHRAQASECPVPTVTRSNNVALPCVDYLVLLLLNLKHTEWQFAPLGARFPHRWAWKGLHLIPLSVVVCCLSFFSLCAIPILDFVVKVAVVALLTSW